MSKEEAFALHGGQYHNKSTMHFKPTAEVVRYTELHVIAFGAPEVTLRFDGLGNVEAVLDRAKREPAETKLRLIHDFGAPLADAIQVDSQGSRANRSQTRWESEKCGVDLLLDVDVEHAFGMVSYNKARLTLVRHGTPLER